MVVLFALLIASVIGCGLFALEKYNYSDKATEKRKSTMEIEHDILEEFGIALGGHQWECEQCIEIKYLGEIDWGYTMYGSQKIVDPSWFDRYESITGGPSRRNQIELHHSSVACYEKWSGTGVLMSTHHRDNCHCRNFRDIVANSPKADFIDGEIIEFPTDKNNSNNPYKTFSKDLMAEKKSWGRLAKDVYFG